MLRPIESNLSLYNVENKASQVKDPNAHQFQSMQQHEISVKAQIQAQTVQPTEKPEGDVKVRERKDERDGGGKGKNRRQSGSSDEQAAEEEKETGQAAAGSGRLNFLA